MQREIDVIVIGAGPAGLAAAIEVGSAGHGCIVVDKMGPGGQLMNLGVLHDFPDAPDGTTGPDLIAMLIDRATSAGVEIGFGEATAIEPAAGDRWHVATSDGDYLAHAVILATGRDPGTTGVANEAHFEGRGLSHCANCDGPLYAGQPVVVHGGGEWAAAEAIELAHVASEVTLVAPADAAPASGARTSALAALPGVRRLMGSIAALEGEDGLARVAVSTADGDVAVEARAIFALAGRQPATAFLPSLVTKHADGRIETDAGMHTPRAGLFACGDVASQRETIAEAIAQGVTAGQNAVRCVAAGS